MNVKYSEEKLRKIFESQQPVENVSKFCRDNNMSRTQYYRYKRAYDERGVAGLKSSLPKAHPKTTSPDIVEQVVMSSLENPALGCEILSRKLKVKGVKVSPTTIYNILLERGLANRAGRVGHLEHLAGESLGNLTQEQIQTIETNNPCFRDRGIAGGRPGEVLVQDTLSLGLVDNGTRLVLQIVVDTFSSFAFGKLHYERSPENAVGLLATRVQPTYENMGLNISIMYTDSGSEFVGWEEHEYQRYLNSYGIEHKVLDVSRVHQNGFMAYVSSVLRRRLRDVLAVQRYTIDFKQLQSIVGRQLRRYNQEEAHKGYVNIGKAPQTIVENYLRSCR